MCDCSRTPPPSVRGSSAPRTHCLLLQCLLSNTRTLPLKQRFSVFGDVDTSGNTRRLKPECVKMYSPRRGMMCSPWGTLLCCADTRRRSSAPGRSGKTAKRWLEGETSSSRCRCLWCFTLRFSVSFSALKMSLLDRHAFFSVCVCDGAWHTPGGWTQIPQRGSGGGCGVGSREMTSTNKDPRCRCFSL